MSALAVPVDLRQLPLRALVAHAARCARRVCPLYAANLEHPEAAICGKALAASIVLCDHFAADREVDPVLVASAEEATIRALMLAGESAGSDNLAAYAANAAYAAINATRVLLEACSSDDPESAAEAVLEAVGIARDAAISADQRVAAAAAQDEEILKRLFLGHYPELGDPIDPAATGLLGPLFPHVAPQGTSARGAAPAKKQKAVPKPESNDIPSEKAADPAAIECTAESPRTRATGAARENLKGLIGRIQKSRAALRRRRKSLAARQGRLQECRDELARREAEIARQQQEFENRQQELQDRQQQCESLRRELAAEREAIEKDRLRADQDLQWIEEQRATIDSERAALEERKQSWSDDVQRHESERQRQEESRQALESAQAELQTRAETLSEREARLEQERAAFRDENERQSQLVQELQADEQRALATLREQVREELERERGALHDERGKLERERNELAATAERLSHDRADQERRARELDEQERRLREADDQLDRRSAELNQDRMAFDAAQAELRDRLAELEAREEQHRRSVTRFETECRQEAEAADALHAERCEQIEQRQQALDALRRKTEEDCAGMRESLDQELAALAAREQAVQAAEHELSEQRAASEREAAAVAAGCESLQESEERLNSERTRLETQEQELQSRQAELATAREQLQAALQEVSRQRESQKKEGAGLESQKQQIIELNARIQDQQRQLADQAAELAARAQGLQSREAELRAAHERVRAEHELLQKERNAFLDETARGRLERGADAPEGRPGAESVVASAADPLKRANTTPDVPAAESTIADQFLQLQEQRRLLQVERARMQQELTLLRAARDRGNERTVTPSGDSANGLGASSQARIVPLALVVSAGGAAPSHVAVLLTELQKLATSCGCPGVTVAARDCRQESAVRGKTSRRESGGYIEFALSPAGNAGRRSAHEAAHWNQFQSCLRLLFAADNGVLSAFASGTAVSKRHPLRAFATKVRQQYANTPNGGGRKRSGALPIDEMHQQRERIDRLIVQLESQFNLQCALVPLSEAESHGSAAAAASPVRRWKRWIAAASLAAGLAAAGYHYGWPSVPDLLTRIEWK
jgi:hypothetical protein